ncbi:MAG: nucleotidyltransferase [Bacilli bacterium]
MKTVGIICEYSPFHNGHLHHLNEVKKICPNHTIILIMSASFLQRGEPTIINKWDKTKIALKMGIDLIIELPFTFSTQSADIFAHGAITILNHLKVDKIIFGSELNNITVLTQLAQIQTTKEYQEKVKIYLKQGINYPTALSKALKHFNNIEINTPNDILAISYIREIITTNSNIIPICIKRTNNYHETKLQANITSATSIRIALKNKQNITNYIPKITSQYIKKALTIENYFSLIKYKIISDKDLSKYQTVDEGIENRIKKYILKVNSSEELIQAIKTKRYTYNKIKRMLIHILCNFTKEEAKANTHITYIRVLGFNNLGQKHLKNIKKDIKIPLLTKYKPQLDLELRITAIYASVLNKKDQKNLIEKEYKNTPIIFDNLDNNKCHDH